MNASTPSGTVHYYIGNEISFIGFPIVVVTQYELRDPRNRKIESFIILVNETPKLIASSRYNMRNFDEAYISQEAALRCVIERVQAKLDSVVYEAVEEKGRQFIPYDARFKLAEVRVDDARFFAIEKRLVPIMDEIGHKSHCERLKADMVFVNKVHDQQYEISVDDI